jgi:hypothetical protein
MNIADNHWMKSIGLRRRDLDLGALALGAAVTLPGSSTAQTRAEKAWAIPEGGAGRK